MKVTIWHNPRCSKSRAALEILRAAGIAPQIVEYLKTPPDVAGLREVIGKLGIAPRQLLRTGEPAYRELDLAATDLDDAAIYDAMARHPVLIERPVVIAVDRAVVGRPPERVRELIQVSPKLRPSRTG